MNNSKWLSLTFLSMAIFLTSCAEGAVPVTTEVAPTQPFITTTEALATPREELAGPTTHTSDTQVPVVPLTGFGPSVRSSQVLNGEVRTPNGQGIGRIEDLIIRNDTATVDYVLVDPNETPGTGIGLLPVPWKAFQFSGETLETGEHVLFLDVPEHMLKDAPRVDLNHLPTMYSYVWDASIGEFWEGLPAFVATGTPEPKTWNSDTSTVGQAKYLFGGHLFAAGDNPAGMVEDLLIERSTGRVSYYLIEADTSHGTSGSGLLIPVPFALGKIDQDMMMRIPVNLRTLMEAPSFSSDSMPDFSLPGWDDPFREFWAGIQP